MKPRKAIIISALFILFSTVLVLPLLYSPKGTGVVASSIEVLGYTTNKERELCARVRLKNTGTATLMYEPGCFAGGAPDIRGQAETEIGWVASDGPRGGTASPCWVLPGSNRVFSIPLPDMTSRWQITYDLRAASSPRERALISLCESGWWNRFYPATGRMLSLFPYYETPATRTHSDLFVVPSATAAVP
jgi:hypothetical protein